MWAGLSLKNIFIHGMVFLAVAVIGLCVLLFLMHMRISVIENGLEELSKS